jgi:tripeptidyl-peptidase I
MRLISFFLYFMSLVLAGTWSLAQETRAVYDSNIPVSVRLNSREQSLSKDALTRVDFALTVPETQVKLAEKALQDMSDPTSPGFAQHWSMEQVIECLAPPRSNIRQLIQTLNDSNIPHSSLRLSRDRGHLYLDTTVRDVEQLLNTRYSAYSAIQGRSSQIVSSASSLPESISKLVDFVVLGLPGVQPRSDLESLQPRSLPTMRLAELDASAAPSIDDCFAYIRPECLRILYNIPESAPNTSTNPRNSFGIYEGYPGTWLAEDLDDFFHLFQPDLVGSRPQWLSIDGTPPPAINYSFFNIEANLDFEYAMSLTDPQSIVNIEVGGPTAVGDTNFMLAAFDQEYCATGLDPDFDYLSPNTTADCGTADPPLVISISDAWNEANFTDQYVQRQCLEFLKLGLRGVTVIAGSGDRGTADQLGDCKNAATGPGKFSANFPVSCPYVVAVGATQLSPTNQSWAQGGETPFPPETAFSLDLYNYHYTSGGGFSSIFPTPGYQSAAVQSYLADPAQRDHLANLSSMGYFDARGRAYPDVSAVALNYLIYSNGELMTVSGTSGSTPVFASMIARINDARLQIGKRPVGFVNPVLYALADQFVRDIDTGSNGGCGVPEAFTASKGWDPVTGLGTVDFKKLLNVYLKLP